MYKYCQNNRLDLTRRSRPCRSCECVQFWEFVSRRSSLDPPLQCLIHLRKLGGGGDGRQQNRLRQRPDNLACNKQSQRGTNMFSCSRTCSLICVCVCGTARPTNPRLHFGGIPAASQPTASQPVLPDRVPHIPVIYRWREMEQQCGRRRHAETYLAQSRKASAHNQPMPGCM